MAHRGEKMGARRLKRAGTVSAVAAAAVVILLAAQARAQGPQFDVGAPPGAAGGASTVGMPLGQANFPDFGTPSSTPISGGAGNTRSHVPAASQAAQPAPLFGMTSRVQFVVPPIQPLQVQEIGNLSLIAGKLVYGPPNAMTLDVAIERLVKENIDLYAMKLEIPMAKADILTANLRANPVFYADTQLIPYGHFSFLRPGGPAQTDININYPLDVSFKRQARTRSATVAMKVSEAQLQDAIRNQIDNLYTVFVDVVATGLTLEYSEIYVQGLSVLYAKTEESYRKGQVRKADLLAVRVNLEKAQLQVRESRQAKATANQALALLLNMPLNDMEQIEKLDVHDQFGVLDPLPLPQNALILKALDSRPDLAAIRLGINRAESDVKLARANAYPDVYLLYQPYTYQNNTYLGVPSATSWTLGVTATVPLYNRNQGNITRAKINVMQTQAQAKSVERTVVSDVLNAVREHQQAIVAVIQLKDDIEPKAKEVLESARARWAGGETSILDFLDAQQAYNDVVKQYRDALVRSRRADLDVNTAIGDRVVP